MTIGFPDWSRLQMQGGQQLLSAQYTINGVLVTPTMDTLGFGFINVSIDDLGNLAHKEINVRFYADQAATIQISEMAYIIQSGSFDIKQFAVLSRYVNITIQNLETPANEIVTAFVYGSNSVMPPQQQSVASGPFINSSQNIAAGAFMTLFAPYTYMGPATLELSQYANNKWYCITRAWTKVAVGYTDTGTIFGSQYGQSIRIRVSLPACPIQLLFRNTDTVAQTLVATITLG